MSKKGFNLLRPQIEPPTVWTKMYDFTVGSARIVVVLVELVVVIAFVIRVVVDVQGKNLDEEIEVKEAIVKSFQQAEVRYRRLQQKTEAFNLIWTSIPTYSELYSEINSYLPPSAQEITIQLDDDQLFVTGVALVGEIGDMEEAFKNSDSFVKTELDQIESEGGSQDVLGSFTLRASITEIEMRQLEANSESLLNQQNLQSDQNTESPDSLVDPNQTEQ